MWDFNIHVSTLLEKGVQYLPKNSFLSHLSACNAKLIILFDTYNTMLMKEIHFVQIMNIT